MYNLEYEPTHFDPLLNATDQNYEYIVRDAPLELNFEKAIWDLNSDKTLCHIEDIDDYILFFEYAESG